MFKIYRWTMESIAQMFLKLFGNRLTAVFGNVKMATWIANFACFFNVRGAAILWYDAPWFHHFDQRLRDVEEDCSLNPFNEDPVGFYQHRGFVFWWERPGQIWRWMISRPRRLLRPLPLPKPVSISASPELELDPFRCSED